MMIGGDDVEPLIQGKIFVFWIHAGDDRTVSDFPADSVKKGPSHYPLGVIGDHQGAQVISYRSDMGQAFSGCFCLHGLSILPVESDHLLTMRDNPRLESRGTPFLHDDASGITPRV